MRLDHLLSNEFRGLVWHPGDADKRSTHVIRLAAVQDELEDTIVFYHSSVAKGNVCGPVAQVVRALC